MSPSQRQSGELFRKVLEVYNASTLELPKIVSESALRFELENGSRVIALPGSESTTRGYSAATAVIIDEASRVPDPIIAAVRPSLATTNGRIILLSTPYGKRGFFYEAWANQEGWEKTMVLASECPRIAADWLAEQRKEMGEFTYSQEYECQFLDAETSVFTTAMIEQALSSDCQPLWRAA